MYIAKVHIGGKYMPGDVLPDDTPAEMLEWLMSAGAVRVTAPVVFPAPASAQKGEDTQENDTDVPADGNNGEDEQPDDTDDRDDEGEDEFDDEAEVPEIDVMAGIVQTEQKPAEAPMPPPKASPGRSRRRGTRNEGS